MSDHVLKLIEELRAEVSKAEETIRPNKLLANQLCERAGIPPIYADVGEQSSTSVLRGIRRNMFYGRPLSTCIREYFDMRAKLPIKEATLDEIYDALKEGGYDVKASGPSEEDQKRGVSIALGKNSQTFHRLASGDFGLVSWYSNIKEKKAKAAPNGATAESESAQPNLPPGSPEEFTTKDMPE